MVRTSHSFLERYSGLPVELDTSTGKLNSLVGNLSSQVVSAAVRGMNRNPAFLAGLLAYLDPVTVSGALNENPDFLRDLIQGRSGSLGEAAAEGLRENWLTGMDFLPSLIAALDPAVIAAVINANPDFLAGMISNTSSGVARKIAEGINENVTFHPFGQDLVSALITNISPLASQALAQGINENVAGNVGDNLLTALLADVSDQVGTATAVGLNNNPAFVRILVENISADTAVALAQGINSSCRKAHTDPAHRFLRNLLANTSTTVANALAQGLDHNPQKEALITVLIDSLDASLVAPVITAGINSNAAGQTMIQEILSQLDAGTAQSTALALNATDS